ncbi:Uncharacterized protein APZ42_006118, partial [Daphnia magna]
SAYLPGLCLPGLCLPGLCLPSLCLLSCPACVCPACVCLAARPVSAQLPGLCNPLQKMPIITRSPKGSY